MTTRTGHTPGPWHTEYQFDTKGSYEVYGSEGQCIATVRQGEDKHEVNGNLIAAAPEMLGALHMALATIQRVTKDHGHSFNSTQGTQDIINTAIAKAEGRQS